MEREARGRRLVEEVSVRGGLQGLKHRADHLVAMGHHRWLFIIFILVIFFSRHTDYFSFARSVEWRISSCALKH